ncbi:MAG: hypothetical protein PVF51_06940 [Nitrospirota bacterium]
MIALLVRFLLVLLALWAARQVWRLLTLPTAPGADQTEELVECATCGTYSPKAKAATALFSGQRRYFCDARCLEKYDQAHHLGDE